MPYVMPINLSHYPAPKFAEHWPQSGVDCVTGMQYTIYPPQEVLLFLVLLRELQTTSKTQTALRF